ncbi:hypothetical protein LEMLEM_LOCUS11206, partial [Lemmus lemmus]
MVNASTDLIEVVVKRGEDYWGVWLPTTATIRRSEWWESSKDCSICKISLKFQAMPQKVLATLD